MRWFRCCPLTLAAIAFSVFIMAVFAWAVWLLGNRDYYPNSLKGFLIPGMLPLYVLGTLTNSPIIGWTSFVAGMLGFCGLVGGILDLALHMIRRWIKRNRVG